jgi:hypothetical protein
MTHIAIQEQLDGKTADWMEKVSDEQYQVDLKRLLLQFIVRKYHNLHILKRIKDIDYNVNLMG